MAPSTSRFQLLPDTIFKVVVDYLLSSKDVESNIKTTVSIMHTCQHWRTAYLRKCLSALDVYYDPDEEEVFSFPNLDVPYDINTCLVGKLVRTLTITIPLWTSVINGEVVKWMQTSAVFSSIDFASVTKLIINAPYNLLPYTRNNYEAQAVAKNISAFFRHLKSLTPNANTIKLLLPGCLEWPSEEMHINLVESSIVELVCGRNFTFCERLGVNNISKFNPTAISELTFLCHVLDMSFTDPYATAWLFKASQHNAKTLKRIEIPASRIQLLEQLLFSDGLPIIYYSLVKMNIVVFDANARHQEATKPVDFISSAHRGIDVNHLPVLKSLKFYGPFRHTIGYLFGSENRSLEYIDVVNSINALDPRNILSVDMFTRFYGLKAIRFRMEDQDEETISSLIEYKAMCSHIFKSFVCSSSANYSISIGFKVGHDMLEFLNVYNIRAALCELYIPNNLFLFADLLGLLTKVPMLQHLYCSLNDEPPFINNLDMREHPEHLMERYYPLNKPLSKLMLVYNYDFNTQDIHNISWSALLLACLYPQLQNLGFSVRSGENYGPTTLYENHDRTASLAEQADSLCSAIKNLPVDLSLARTTKLSRGIHFF